MIEKKCWFNGVKVMKEEPKSSQTNISWTSSDSDNEDKQFSIEKFKKTRKYKNVNWIKPAISEPVIENRPISPDESPIISSCSVQEMSPVLSQTKNSEISTESSPIIGKKRSLKTMRSKFKQACKPRQVYAQFQSSPDIFESQSTQIIENDSPIKTLEIEGISSFKSTEMGVSSFETSVGSIHIFPSQSSSQITRCNSTESNNSYSLYHQPVTKRKRYKKNGLASQLQKVLNLQKTRISIWKHELYMNKSSDFEGMIEFIILKVKKEYGNIILECSEIKGIDSAENKNIVVLIRGTESRNFVETNKCKLYPPYETKLVFYKSKEITCYYNVTKIIY